MLYGNLIFIKKTGGDGSKYPVTERNIKIGRSENCLIRIYNRHVALEHCQLIIEDNGQATLRNLSNQSILNGKPLSDGDVTLCHGDIFKLGERLARWEYLPTSKFYKQLLSPTGRLVAVVMPQQRSLKDQATPGTSTSKVSVLKSTLLGKRSFSERTTSENASSVKIRKSCGSELIHEGKGDLQKSLTGQRSLKPTKWVLTKERKSTSEIVGSKTFKGKVGEKCRKSMLPSWKVNFVSPSGRKSSGSRDLSAKSNQKSTRSPKDTVHFLVNDILESKPEKLLLSDSKTEIDEPQNLNLGSKSLNDSVKAVLKKSNTIEKELSVNFSERSTKLKHSLNQSLEEATLKSPSKVVLSTPKKKSLLQLGRVVHSESKLMSKNDSVFLKGTRKMGFIFNKVECVPRQRSIIQKKAKTPSKNASDKSEKTLSLVNKIIKSPDVKTLQKNVIIKTPKSLNRKQSKTPRISILEKVKLDTESQTPPLIDLDNLQSPKKNKLHHQKFETVKSLIAKETSAKLIKSSARTKSSSNSQKIQTEIVSPISSPNGKNFNSTLNSMQTLTSPRSRHSLITASKPVSFSKTSTVFSRRRQRKLSPSSSAERAAKKLKTSCPIKPDKNKKAALLVLGKANRKQQVSQNVKVLLRQKILKKAIKQSTAVSAIDNKIGIKTAEALIKGRGKNTSEPKSKKFRKKNKSNKNSSPTKFLKISGETDVKSPVEGKFQKGTPKSKKILATKVLQTTPRLSTDATMEFAPKQIKQSELSLSNNSDNFMKKTNSPSSIFDKSAENYFFSSNRRCSKRLSYKNDTGRPDFIELSPTALGLIPKNVEIFKTPKDNKRRSSSLVTPKRNQTTGIIKSASTSKIGNRKSVRFSSKEVSINSGFCTPSISERIDYNFSPFDTPNITVDVFVSPLIDQNAVSKQNLNEFKITSEMKEVSSNSSKNRKSNSVPKTFFAKHQSPSSKKNLHKMSPNPSEVSFNSEASISKSLSSIKVEKQSKASDEDTNRKSNLNVGSRQLFSTPINQESLKNSLSDVTIIRRSLHTPKEIRSPKNNLTHMRGIKKLMRTPKVQKSPKNDLTDVKGIKKLMRTPKVQKSPKNDLTDLKGVKKLMRTPKVQKSPKNDLTDVKGVKKLMRTPKVQKSPKNDLTDVKGVKKLMRTPKVQKSPKNDLTDVKGVKKLMRTPKVQKSPKNDLTDVKGVKKLMRTPKVQKSPKNDLTDVKGVKKLMRTPKVQKSPKNDLTDVKGVKKLMRTPKVQKSPKNDLMDVKGVKKLMRTPKVQKSPKNDLMDVTGIKRLFESPGIQKSSEKDLTDLTEVRKLLRTPLRQRSPRNSLSEVNEVEKPFESSIIQQFSKNSLEDAEILLSQAEESFNTSAEMKQLSMISKSSEALLNNKKTVNRKSQVKDFRAIRGRRTTYSRSKDPKNDLSDVTGVRELFSRHKITSDYNVSLTGVAELFDFPKAEVAFEQKINFRKKLMPESVQNVSKTRILRPKKKLENQVETQTSRILRFRKAVKEETEKKSTKSTKLDTLVNLQEKKSIKRKTESKTKAGQSKRALPVKISRKRTKKETETSGKKSVVKVKVEYSEEDQSRTRNSRKRRILLEDVEKFPLKLHRKMPASKELTSGKTVETSEEAISTLRTRRATRKETSLKGVKKVPEKKVNSRETDTATSEVQLKKAIKTGTKQIQKVQNKRSQIKPKKNVVNNEKKESPRKTRSNRANTSTGKISKLQSKVIGKRVVRNTAKKENLSPMVKRSTRRK